MDIEKIFEINPLVTDPKYGPEPSLRDLIGEYYAPHFPEDYKTYAQEYIDKVIENFKKGEFQ